MNFYRDFCQNRLKNIEENFLEAAATFDVNDDEEIDIESAITAMAKLTADAELVKSMLTTMAAAKVYKIGQTYQVIDAVQSEDLEIEASGVANLGLAALENAHVGFNLAHIGVGQGYSNPAYPRVISRIPIRHIHRLGPMGLFNGCLFQENGEALFSCRTQGFPSRTLLYRPNEDLFFGDPEELSLPESFKYCSIEDVRIFRHAEKNLASFTLAGQTEKGWVCQMVMAEISKSRELVDAHAFPSPTGSQVEKNWVFFSCGERLFTVYYPAPHVVYQVDMTAGGPTLGQRWESENWKAADLMENARGGAPPVRVGDEFYHFYHSQHRRGHGTSYQTSLYTFEARPPWNLKRAIAGPLLGLVPSKRQLDVIFVIGAGLKDGQWHLSCGLQDQETVGITIGFDDIERMLTKVSSD